MTNAIQVGEILRTYNEINALPVGTVVGNTHQSRGFTKLEDGRWQYPGRTPYPAEEAIALSVYVVKSYPAGYTPDDPPARTLHQFMHWFRDQSMLAMERHGVHYATVEACMAELGCTQAAFPPGPGLVIECVRDRAALPDGTVVRIGVPERVESFGMYVRKNSDFVHLLGDLTSVANAPMTVESVPDPEVAAWLAEEPTEASEQEILQFRRKAWVAARKMQQEQSWCGTFNNIARSMGLSEEILQVTEANGTALGGLVTTAQAANLPVGTILRWVRLDGQKAAWYVRVEDSGNAVGTRRLFGYLLVNGVAQETASSNYPSARTEVMYLPSVPGAEMSLDVNIMVTLPVLPPGTELHYHGGSPTDLYMVARDHRIAGRGHDPTRPPARGDHDLHDFSEPQNLRVIRFGAAR